MARGLIFSAQSRTTSNLFLLSSTSIISPSKWVIPFLSKHPSAPSQRFFCKCSNFQEPIDMSKYKDTFSKRMGMAGLKPHHSIALGVSGGPDSMALCVLAASWKASTLNGGTESNGFIDGLLAIIVDHGLRAESQDEANLVSNRVSKMGIRCEIARCEWLDGRPKLGHLQEAARDMRYQTFQRVCIQHKISVLLIAHHADDQAELFILRLSRNSGVLGLAGMAFTSQLFSSNTPHFGESSNNNTILLVRPLMEFSKDDMYRICQGGHQEWVEDPTNHSQLFARNRIRMSLKDLSSSNLKSELQAIISICRETRTYVDQICSDLVNRAVEVMPQGYAVIDLDILNPSKVNDICLSKFISMVLQFISQRHRQVRGSTSLLLLDYIRTFPCKTSFTAAGCHLCPVPRSRGTKLLVCCSVNFPLPSKVELLYEQSGEEQKYYITNELEQIIADGKSFLDSLVPDASDVQFLDVPSESILMEAQRRNFLNESNYRRILSLQREEILQFRSKSSVVSDEADLKHEVRYDGTSPSVQLKPGQVCYFMKRFLVTWNLGKEISNGILSVEEANCDGELKEERWHRCSYCLVNHDMAAQVRHMVDVDWLYLAELSKCHNTEELQQQRVLISQHTKQWTLTTNICSEYVRLAAQRALLSLKSMPVAARRSLPVLVNDQGLLLSIPSIGFKHCPRLTVSAEFKPRIPLGGGHSSFI